MCETWQQLNPWNVWELSTATWMSFRGYLEEKQRQREAASNDGNHY